MAYREQNITLDMTLPVVTKLGNFVCEFDCKVHFACWEDDRDEWDWEAREIEIEKSHFQKAHTITKQSDPVLWEALLRGIKLEEGLISERVVERAREAA